MRIPALFFAVLFALATPAVQAQSGVFDVALRGKAVGTASFQIAPAENGLLSTSTIRVSTQGLEYAFSKSEHLSAAHHLRRVELNAAVNGSAVHLAAELSGSELLLTTSANGRTTTGKLAAHAGSVFLPDFDPGALQTLLTLATARNNSGIWAVIPRQAGSVADVKIATYPDEKGTLDGQPIAVHHLVATSAGADTHLFAGPTNQLLQAELPQAGFALVRKGFVLTPPAKAPAPPPVDPDSSAPAGQ